MKQPIASAVPGVDRIASLQRSGLLDSPAEESFDRLARLACRLLNAPVALISLVDEDRQFFKSCVGLPEPWASRRETPLSHSFCRYAVESGAPLVIDDARHHELVKDNPAVAELGVVAYAGIPLVDGAGQVLGTFCVMDHRPRHWTAEAVEVLSDLTASVRTEIQLRETARAAELRRSEEKGIRQQFEELVQGLDAVVWEMDVATFCFTFVSQRAEELLGYPVRRWIDEPTFWQDVLLHPDDRGWALDFCQSATRNSRDHEFEYRAVRADGDTVWLRDLVRVVRDESGTARQLRGVMIDISDEKQAAEELREREAQLRASEESYRAIFQHSSAIWVHDLATGAMLDVNPAGCELFGYTRDELMALGHDALLYPGSEYTAERVAVYMARAAAGETPRFEWMGRHRDGSPVWGDITLRRVSIAGVDRILALVRDITEQKQIECALVDSEESYRTLFDLASDALFVHDPDSGAILDANRHACEIYGASLDDLKARGLDIIGRTHGPFTRDSALQYIRLAAAGEPQRFEWLVEGAGGEAVWSEVRLTRISILGQDRVIANLRNIQERKAAEEARVRAEESAQRMAGRMRAVAGAAAGVIGAENVDSLQEVLRGACREVISFDAFALALYDPADHTLAYLQGYDDDMWIPAETISAAGTPAERVIRSRTSLVTRRSDDPAAAGALLMGTGRRSESIIRTPILGGERVLGVLSVQSYTPDLYGEQDVEVLEAIASLAATALLNLELLAEVRASEESYRTIFEASGDAIYILDRETGAILDVNRAACALNGYPPEEMKARGIGGLSYDRPPHNWENAQELIRRAAAGEPQRIDWLARHSSGRDVWGEVTLQRVTVLGEDRVLATARDITERKAAEEARRQAERDAQAMASRMRAVAGAAAGVIGAESVDALQAVLRDECREVIPFDTFAMATYDEAEHTLAYLPGYDGDILVPGRVIDVAGTPSERVLRTRTSLITRRSDDPAAAGSRVMGTGRRSESIIRAPILSGERVLGMLSVQSYTADQYAEQDVEVLEALASLAATALLNLELLAERQAAEAALLHANEELELRVAERTDELQRRTHELEAVFRALPDLYFRFDQDGIIREYRSGSGEGLFIPPAELLNRPLAEVLPPHQSDVFLNTLAEVKRTGQLVCLEYELPFPDGPRDYEARMVPLEDGSMIAIVRNITDRKRAEQELRQREEHFRRLIENAQDFVEIVELDGTTRYISPAIERILGYTPDELIGTAGVLLADPAEMEVGRAKLQEAAANPGTTVPGEFRVRHKDGSIHVLETFARTLAPDSTAEGIVINARDITERKHFEEALQQREEWFRRLTENSSDLVQVIDATGRISYTGPSVLHLLGYPPDELLGRSAVEFVHPDDLAAATEILADVVANPGVSRVVRNRVRHGDGRWRMFEVLSRTMLPDSAAEGIVVNARDITERYEAEQAVRDSEEHFRRLTEMGSDLVMVISPTAEVSYASPSVQRIIGYAPEELVGTNALELVHPDDLEVSRRTLARMMDAPGITTVTDVRLRHRDGGYRLLESLAHTLAPDTAAEGIVVNARDITERRQFEEALRDSEARYRSLIENAHDIVTLLDSEGRITYQSPQVERVLGYDPAEMVGRIALDYVHPDDRSLPEQALQQIFASPNATHISEYRFRHKDGSWRYLETLGRALLPDSPQHGLVFNTRDVTERRESQRLLQEREEHFRKLIETSHDLIQTLDPQGRIVYTGPSVERLLGYTPEEVTGRGADDFIHPDDHALVAANVVDALTHPGTVVHLEYRVLHKDGRWRWFEAIGRTLAPDSAEQGMVANARDVTERREAEMELKRQRAYYEQLLDSVDAGVAAWDPEGRFEYVSTSAVPEPHAREWIIGKTHDEYYTWRGKPLAVAAVRHHHVRQAAESRRPTEYEEAVTLPDGSPGHMLRRYWPVFDEAGEVERVIGYSVDISELKHAEEALRHATDEAERAREAAERANRAKSEFLSRMSHELRTPMNSILGFAQLLDRAPLAPDQKKGVGHILKAGRHLLQLINEVLEIARIEAGRHSLSLEPVRLATVLQEAVALVRPLAAQWRVDLDDGPGPGCATFVQADRQRLTQVLLNLLANAIKYNRPGGRVRVSCATMGEGERQRLLVRVEDTGRGIAADKADQLFTPFARLGAEQSDVEGTGLGLALSQRLTEAMGGTLSLQSTGPEGSVFRMELQLAADPLQRLEESVAAPTALDGVPHAPAKLLYIEDNLANLSLVETILLSRPQWRTMPALQGLVGVDLAREHTPHLILLDLHLPDISGEEVLRRLRAEPRTASIPVVVITADATRSTVDRLRAAGADAYLTKPLDVDEFLETVERFLPSPE